MKRTSIKAAAVLMAASLLLSGCSTSSAIQNSTGSTEAGSRGDDKSEPIKDLVLADLATNEMRTFNILNSQTAVDFGPLTNMVEGLLEADIYGRPVPALAKEWGTDDNGLTWTFKLREGVQWVDVNGNPKADCNAWDFVTGLEWILNFHKNGSSNTSMPNELIKGASEYYQYTKSLTEEEGRALKRDKFMEMVGIAVPDDYTVVYTCNEPKPYFDTVALYCCLYPAPQALIEELGADGFLSMDNQTMWYNGCYLMPSYIQGNEKILTKNPMYWDKECQLFDSITIKMIESNDVAFQLYQSGEIDNVNLTESNLKTIYDDESNPFHDQLIEKRPSSFSYQIHYNFDKRLEDGSKDINWNTAAANKAFRLAWYYGLDLTNFYKRSNPIYPLKCENNCYTMQGLVYTSDGTDYTDLVKERLGIPEYNGKTMVRLDKEKGQQYKKQAMEELSKKGVTFPVVCDYYISGSSQTALDDATVLKQVISDGLGDDFVVLNIKTYVSSFVKEARDSRLHSIVVTGWAADYGDPQNYLGQQTYGEDNAWFSVKYANVNDAEDEELIADYRQYTELVHKADAICDDIDARYEAYADAEAFMIKNALVVPCYYNIRWGLSHINFYSIINSMYGLQSNKYKNWETSKTAYTTEQYKEFEKAYIEGLAK